MNRPDAEANDREIDEMIAGIHGVLAEESTWMEPPPELADAIMAQLETEPTPFRGAHMARRARPARRRWVRPVLGAMAAAAALVVGLVAINPFGGEGDNGDVREVALAGTELAPDASATAEIRDTPTGVSITLDVHRLVGAPDGFFYQAWVKGPAGLVPIGTFHMRGDENGKADEPVELWSGVDLSDYPDITVTLEPEDGDPASSGQRVLAGTVK